MNNIDINPHELVIRIGDELQQLEEILQNGVQVNGRIKFPWGVIGTADHYRNILFFVHDYVLRSNLAYTLMLIDVYRWLLDRFDIKGTAREMLIKELISLLGNMMEAVLKYVVYELGDREKTETQSVGVKRACSILIEHRIISQDDKKNLVWLWSMRNKEHLFTLADKEFQQYNDEHYQQALQIWGNLVEALQNASRDGLIP